MKAFSLLAAAAAASLALSAQAFPIAAPGTEGSSIVVAATGDVFATYLGNSADDSNDLLLNGTLIFNNHTTPVGTTIDLGSFNAGTELVFEMRNNTTGLDYFSGDASRNPDGMAHARVESNFGSTSTSLVSYEDLFNGPFDFNDLSFSFTNTVAVPAVPEPETYALLLAGLGAVGVWARRRKA